MAKRRTARYQLKKTGGRIVHRGITNRPIQVRRREHKAPGTRIVQIGPRVTRKTALKWEREGGTRL